MTIEAISDVLNVFVPTGLIAVAVWWLLAQGWPYWKERDQAARIAREAAADREYQREMAAIAAQNVQSEALVSLANAQNALASAVDGCPLRPAND